MDDLLSALDDESNSRLLHLTTEKIKQINFSILSELQLDEETMALYLQKLKEYMYIDEAEDLKHGAFIKWIPILDPDYLPLHFCGIICDIQFTGESTIIKCKNFMHRHYTFTFDECLVFQKLSKQELAILAALDFVQEDIVQENKE